MYTFYKGIPRALYIFDKYSTYLAPDRLIIDEFLYSIHDRSSVPLVSAYDGTISTAVRERQKIITTE